MKKVAIITGAGGGIGRCHALAFAAAGYCVVVNDLGVQRDGSQAGLLLAEAVVQEIRDLGGEAVANRASVASRTGAESIIGAALDSFGRIDVLVNNAGILRDRSLLKMTDDDWNQVMDVHAKGSWLCTQIAGHIFKEQGEGGAIINTTSTTGLIGNFGQANYAVAKAGIAGLTRVTAIEFARMGVRCNAIMPLAKTRMTEDLDAVGEDLTPDRISPLVVFLASDEAKNVTGRIFGIWGEEIREFYYDQSEGHRFENGPSVKEIRKFWSKISKPETEWNLPLTGSE